MMILILLTPLLFFFKGLTIFFVQDDFWLLKISQASTFQNTLNFFIPLKEVVWYRPLSSQVFFFISRLFFGLKPLGYHLIVILTHVGTMYGLFILVKKLTQKKEIAYLSALFYGTHQLHTVSLSWLATYSFVLGPFIFVLTLLFFSEKKYWLALFMYVLGVLTIELFIVLSLVFIVYQYIYEKKVDWKKLAPYFITGLFFCILRYFLVPAVFHADLYSVHISWENISVIKFYILRILGFPLFYETIPLIYKIGILFGMCLFYGGLSLGFVSRIINKKNISSFYLWLSIGAIAILPFIFLTQHMAPYYAAFSWIGTSVILAILLEKSKKLLPKTTQVHFIIGILSLFLLLQYIGIRSTYNTHWLYKRAELAKKLVEQKSFIHPIATEEYFALGAGSAISIYELNKSLAPQLVFKQWSSSPPMVIDPKAKYQVSIKTSLGTMRFNLFTDEVPITVNNFIFLTQEKFYEGMKFYRVVKNFIIESGDPLETGWGGPGYRFVNEGVKREYKRGDLVMGNRGTNTNGSKFFIVHQDLDWPIQYTVFGKMVPGDLESFLTLDKIASTQVKTNMNGEISSPVEPIVIEEISLIKI